MDLIETFQQLAAEADKAVEPTSDALWKRVISFAGENPHVLTYTRAAYILGYAWYCTPEATNERYVNVKKYLELAIQQDPSDWYAFLYLGHLYYDYKEYRAALEQFLRIPNLAFEANDQRWRNLKIKELCVCCYFKLRQPTNVVVAFEDFILLATSCDETDVHTVHELPQLIASLAYET